MPEMTAGFCRADDLISGSLPNASFGCILCIGEGGSMCDYTYKRIEKQQSAVPLRRIMRIGTVLTYTPFFIRRAASEARRSSLRRGGTSIGTAYARWDRL